jgi:hypothetical protein
MRLKHERTSVNLISSLDALNGHDLHQCAPEVRILRPIRDQWESRSILDRVESDIVQQDNLHIIY